MSQHFRSLFFIIFSASRKPALQFGLIVYLVSTLLGLPVFAQGHKGQKPVPGGGPHAEDELLVGFRPGVSLQRAQAIQHAAGAALRDHFQQINVRRLRVLAAQREAIANVLSHHPEVAFVENNFFARSSYTPNDPSYSNQWHWPKIEAPAGWEYSTGQSQVVVAVIDSGIDPNHPDLAAKLLPGYSFLTSTTDTHDVLGHGTAVAGTAAAIADNLTGVAGMAWQNSILPLVVLNADDWATYADIAAAIMYAADHGAQVINISIGGSSYSITLQNAVNYAWNRGAVIVASAMNNGSSTPMYPAALTHVLAISATDTADNLASFSNYGNWIALAAPGVNILTTTNGGGYGYWNGTSFSSPIIAGIAALVLSVNPALSNADVVTLLQQYSDDRGAPGYDVAFGYGRVNAGRTLAAASTIATPSDTTPPVATLTTPTGGLVSGTLSVAVNATDNVGVTTVELFIDGSGFASTTTAPYQFTWDTTLVTDGWHTLVAYATDAAGNVAASQAVGVQVANALADEVPPAVVIDTPTDGSKSSKQVNVSVQATDNVGVVRVDLLIDGDIEGTDTSAPYTFRWNANKASKGAHRLEAIAYDAAGNFTVSTPVTVYK